MIRSRTTGRRAGTIASAVLMGALVCTLLVSPAHAAEDPLAPEFVTEVTSVWTRYDVPAQQQNALLRKLRDGDAVDAMRTNSDVVSTETRDHAGSLDTVQRYADGSINVFSVTKPAVESGGVAPLSLDNCTKDGTKWTNCSAWGWYTAVTLSFFVSLDVGSPSLGRPATIISFWSPSVKCAAGTTCSTPTFELVRRTQSGSYPAQVNLVTTWSTIVGSGTTRMAVRAIDGSAYVA